MAELGGVAEARASSTAYAISPDSGESWIAEGTWRVADGIYRIPLPLPTDGLIAVNVYAIAGESGLTLIDGGWAIEAARNQLNRCLQTIGYGFGDIRQFLVTHIHRDHYTMATVLGHEYGAAVVVGSQERPALDLLNRGDSFARRMLAETLEACGSIDLAAQWIQAAAAAGPPDLRMWQYPDSWIDGDQRFLVGERVLDAIHTPGHTPGHHVFAEQREMLLFAGDHVLPTITPSIGFSVPPTEHPLGDFMASLSKVRSLPDMKILPAHGPLSPSSHTRVDELLVFHHRRLELSLEALSGGAETAYNVAQLLPWTRSGKRLGDLDLLGQSLATLETKAHLELLVARGDVTRRISDDGVARFAVDLPNDRAPVS